MEQSENAQAVDNMESAGSIEGKEVSASEIVKMNQVTIEHAVRLSLRNLLNTLTSPGISGTEKVQIKQAIERALLFAFDHDIQVTNAGLAQTGKYHKLEQTLAAQIARLIDNTNLIKSNQIINEEN